jgi:thiamine-phosphate diphosphorylase
VPRALLCLVTDRRRLAARLGCDEVSALEWLVIQARAAAHAGVDFVQIREGDLPAATLVALSRRVRAALEGTAARVLVNDRVDVAIAAGAHGVHLKASSIAPGLARELLPAGATIGVSVHGADAAARAGRVDYLVAGAVFATASKPAGWPTLGLAGLVAVVEAAAGVPVLAIGGVEASSARSLRQAGARGMAGIEAFLPAAPPDRVEASVHETVSALRFAFDSPEHVT